MRIFDFLLLETSGQYLLTSALKCFFFFGRNREEKSLRHVAMVSKFLDDNKPIKSLKSLFALFQTSPILFSFIYFGKSRRNFLWDRIYRYLSLEKESNNFCAEFTYSIKRAREIKKFHVVVVQRRQGNVQNSTIHVQSCLLI